MFVLRIAASVLAAVLILVGQASGQTIEEQTRAMAGLQAQLDKVLETQATLNRIYGSTDVAFQTGAAIFVAGWAFECSSGNADTVEVEVDGVVRTAGIAGPRGERPDVLNWAVSSGACDAAHTPLRTGVVAVVDISTFDLGVPHTVALRLRNAAGIAKRFNVLVVNKPEDASRR